MFILVNSGIFFPDEIVSVINIKFERGGNMSIFKPNVKKLKSKKEVDGLIKAKNHKDKNTRTKVAEVLGKTEAEKAVGLLLQSLIR